MRLLEIEPIQIRGVSIKTAFDQIFHDETLREVHGPSLKATPWDGKNKRLLKFSISLDNVPSEIRRFFCGNKLKITTRQALVPQDARYDVKNSIRMHFLGAELFKLKSAFYLEQKDDGHLSFGGRVEHHAILPPPLNGIAEGFMKQQSEREVDHYMSVVTRRLEALGE
jgi:hypothetical protein